MNEWLYTGSGNSRYSLKYGNAKVTSQEVPMLPAGTLRFKFSRTSFNPSSYSSLSSDKWTWTAYNASEGIWDMTVTMSGSDWTGLFKDVLTFYTSYPTLLYMDIIDGNLTGVETCYETFYDCLSLRSIRVRGTNNITSAERMFILCDNLEKAQFSDLSSLTTAQYMFSNDHKLVDVMLNRSRALQNLDGAFNGCGFTGASFPHFETDSLRTMNVTFAQCTRMTTVPLFDTSTVTSFDSLFSGCSSLASIPLFDLSSAHSTNAMFMHCTSLASIPLLDTSNIFTMSGMFQECTALTSIPLLDLSGANVCVGTFSYCSALTSLPLFNTTNIKNAHEMFYGCTNVESGALALYQQMSTQSYVPNHSGCFYDCGSNTTTGAAELAQIPSSWK